MDKQYLCIDLKSFYASVECVERGLDPLNTNLVVADAARTDKTICLAVSPSLKKYGIPGRPRLFEVKQKLNVANARRRSLLPNRTFYDSSYDAKSLEDNPHFAIDYIVAPPRMALYVEYSTRIYQVYLRHVAPEDIHVYSIDIILVLFMAAIVVAWWNGAVETRNERINNNELRTESSVVVTDNVLDGDIPETTEE